MEDVTDYSNWQAGFGRRFNSLKIFYAIQYFGLTGIQKALKDKIEIANYFSEKIQNSEKFELYTKPEISLVCFRLKPKTAEYNTLNQQFYKLLETDTTKGYITPSTLLDIYFLRFVGCNPNTTKQHVDTFWNFLNEKADEVINLHDK